MLRRACGVDVHRDGFVATLLSSRGYETRKFMKDARGIEAFKPWLKTNKCRAVVMESTGVYWIPLYAGLEGEFEVELANAQKTWRVPGRKTDQSDSEWLAYLLRSGLVEACYVPERKIRVVRELTRLRTKMVQNRTAARTVCIRFFNVATLGWVLNCTASSGRLGCWFLKG